MPAPPHRVIDEIRRLAPHAMITLAGYPQLFNTGSHYDVPSYRPIPDEIPSGGFNTDEVAFLNGMARMVLVGITGSFSLDDRVNGVDVRQEFDGHELGAAATNGLYFNQIWIPGEYYSNLGLPDLFPDDGDGEPADSKKAPESGHPNLDGNRAYAREVSGHLLPIGYTW